MKEGVVGGQGFAVDAGLIVADVQKQNSSNPKDWMARAIDSADAPRAVRAYLDALDDEAFGRGRNGQAQVHGPCRPGQPMDCAEGKEMRRT